MSDLKRIVRSELEKIIEDAIRRTEQREARELVSGTHPHYGRKEQDRTMTKLAAKVYRNAKKRDAGRFKRGRA